MPISAIPIGRADMKRVYENLGGEPAFRAILRDFYQRMSRDILIGFFFQGKDLRHIADQQADFLMRAMGVRQFYKGKAPADAHENLAPILTGHFDRRLRILEETLRGHGVPAADIQTWVAFESAFRDAVVNK